ncbi:hypothetical protein MMC30_005357 [Trapelia coarctata]|nr:hypothetical protein [Trapelia coarctata]
MVSLARQLALAVLLASHIMAIDIGECVPKPKPAVTTISPPPSSTSTIAALGSCSPTTATVYKTTTPAPVTYILTKTIGNYSTIANIQTTTISASPITVTQEVNTTISITSTIKVQQYFTITDTVTATAKKREVDLPITTPASYALVSSSTAAPASCYPVVTTVYQTATPTSVTYYITDTVKLYSTITSFKTQTAPAATVAVTKQDTVTTIKTRTITVQAFVTITETIIGTATPTGAVAECSGNPDCPFGPGFPSPTTAKTN